MSATIPATNYRTLAEFDHSRLSLVMLEHMQEGVDELIGVLEEAARTDYNILASLLESGGDDPFTQWQHYPPGDVQDREHGAVWFYHAHNVDKTARPWDEHGHFHLFTFTEHVPEGVDVIAQPPGPEAKADGLCHLIAVSFTNSGIPNQLFTVNRWVACDWLYAADTVISMIDKFRIENTTDGKDKFALTSRWLSAMLKLYRPQIEWALKERDVMIDAIKADDPEGWSEDKEIEVMSAVTIDIADQIDRIEEAIAAKMVKQ